MQQVRKARPVTVLVRPSGGMVEACTAGGRQRLGNKQGGYRFRYEFGRPQSTWDSGTATRTSKTLVTRATALPGAYGIPLNATAAPAYGTASTAGPSLAEMRTGWQACDRLAP